METFEAHTQEIMRLGQDGKWREAKSLFAKTQDAFGDYIKENPEARAELSWQGVRLVSHSGSLQGALVLALATHKADPGTAGAIKSLAWASLMYARLEDYQKAICYANEVLSPPIDFAAFDRLIYSMMTTPFGEPALGESTPSQTKYRTIDDVDTYTAGLVRANIVNAYALQENIPETRKAADEARKFGEEHNQRECIYWANMLQAYAEKSRELFERALDFEDALKPAGMLHAYLRKAQVLARLGEENDFADRAIVEATRIENYYVLGQAYELAGNLEGAVYAYKRAGLLSMDCPLAKRLHDASRDL